MFKIQKRAINDENMRLKNEFPVIRLRFRRRKNCKKN